MQKGARSRSADPLVKMIPGRRMLITLSKMV